MASRGSWFQETFFWTVYVLGAFLIYAGYRMACQHGEQTPPDRNPVVRLVRRVIPTGPAYRGDRFFTLVGGERVATLLSVVMIVVKATDPIFAVDSVAAILAATSTFSIRATARDPAA